ncbi:Uncharacterised protein [Vibrio cholerae]|nr:Uncharacterised protein [Vibrio cholerae]
MTKAPDRCTPAGSTFTKLPPALTVISEPASITTFCPAFTWISVPASLTQTLPVFTCSEPSILSTCSPVTASRLSHSTVRCWLCLIWVNWSFSTVR